MEWISITAQKLIMNAWQMIAESKQNDGTWQSSLMIMLDVIRESIVCCSMYICYYS